MATLIVCVMCLLCMQDLKYKILVKGKKEHVVECSSSCSDLSSSDEESGRAEGKPKEKKHDKKVGTTSAPFVLAAVVLIIRHA